MSHIEADEFPQEPQFPVPSFGPSPSFVSPGDNDTALPFDETRVRQLDNGLSDALRTLIRHPEQGLAALPAEQALAAVPEAIAAVDRIGETWFDRAETPRQKTLAVPLIDARVDRARSEIDDVARRATAELDDRSVAERLQGFRQDAAAAGNDPAWLRQLGRGVVTMLRSQGRRNGRDEAETESTVRAGLSDVYGDAVEAAIGRDLDDAGKLFAHARDVILPERQAALERHLAEARQDSHVAGIGGALVALPLDSAAPPKPEAYRARAEELTPDDAPPEVRARIALLADGAHRRAEKQWQAERNQAGAAALDWMRANPAAPLAAMDSKLVSQLAPAQAARLQQIETTGRLDSDAEVYAQLDRMAVHDPKAFAELDLGQYRLALDDKDYVRFGGFQKADAGYQRYARGRTLLDAGLVKANVDADSPEARAARDELDRTLRSFETIEGRAPAMADIERVAGTIVERTGRRTDAEILSGDQQPDELESGAGAGHKPGAETELAQADAPKSKRPPLETHLDPAKALPKDSVPGGTWRIELRNHPIRHRGHAYLSLVDPNGKVRSELHGLARSKHTGELMGAGPDGSDLVVVDEKRTGKSWWPSEKVSDIVEGSYDKIVAALWARGKNGAVAINNRDFDYKAHDFIYEAGVRSGEIQNSNSVANTLGRVMGLDLDRLLVNKGHTETFPGWNRDLLDPKLGAYKPPAQFPVTNEP